MAIDGEVIQYLLYVSLDVWCYISFLFNFFLCVSYIERDRERENERGQGFSSDGTWHGTLG